MVLQTAKRKPNVQQVDYIRAIASLAVAIFHLGGVAPPVLNYGWLGVEMFFVLSGFLITGILLNTKKTSNYFKNFYMRRTLRIFPLYFGYLLLYQASFRHLNLPGEVEYEKIASELPWMWLYASNLLISIKGNFITASLNHFWSLAVEEQFYLFWPAVIYFCPAQYLKKLFIYGIALTLLIRCIVL